LAQHPMRGSRTRSAEARRRPLSPSRRLLRLGLSAAAGCCLLGSLLAAFVVVRLWMVPNEGFDVLLISLDTQRADHLGCYGAEGVATPATDGLARRGVLFRSAIAAIPRTTQNVATILTGRYPIEHGVRELDDTLAEGETTLAELLRERGFRTAAFVGGGPLGRDQGIYQGFETVWARVYEQQARAVPVVLRAIGWLALHGHRRYFLWVHLYDPHFYYAPPWPFYSLRDPRNREVRSLYEDLHSGRRRHGELHFQNRLSEPLRAYLRQLYRGEVEYTDFAVGLLLGAVRILGWLDGGRDTLVVLTADHGESLGEHDYFYLHGNYLYEPDVRVPLVVSLPSVLPEGAVVEAQVRSVDILPTILELVDPGASCPASGRSLLSLVRGEERADRPAFIESDSNIWKENPRSYGPGIAGKWLALRDGRYKLIRIPHPEGDRFELYDLEQDPEERVNLYAVRPDVALRLRQELDRWIAAAPRREEKPRGLDEETRRRLRSLGYVD